MLLQLHPIRLWKASTATPLQGFMMRDFVCKYHISEILLGRVSSIRAPNHATMSGYAVLTLLSSRTLRLCAAQPAPHSGLYAQRPERQEGHFCQIGRTATIGPLRAI